MSRDEPLSGLILLDKPTGMTSHEAVKWLRRTLGVRRVGHAGTLDPFASGLLPCLIGPATRLVHYLHGWPKTYVGRIQLGEETPTGDIESATTGGAVSFPPVPHGVQLRQCETRFTGTIQQVPPIYSAKKIGGERAHRIARQGFIPTLLPLPVAVHRFRLRPRDHGRLAFAVRVGTGTYVRALARDLGRFLGTGAHLIDLRRLSIGPYVARQAVTPSPAVELDHLRAALIPAPEVALPLATVTLLDPLQINGFRFGRPLPNANDDRGRISIAPTAVVAVRDPAGALLGIAAEIGGMLQPRVVLQPLIGDGKSRAREELPLE